MRLTVSLALAALLAGCAAPGPDYHAPKPELPAQWKGGSTPGAPHRAWWNELDDPLLPGLLERAVRANPDLESAKAALRETRARYGVSKAARYPTLDAVASATESETGKNLGGAGESREAYAAGLDASWEIDLFGAVGREIEAAKADLEGAEASYKNALVTLAAETALGYVEYRTLQARLAVARQNLETQAQSLEIVQWRHEGGLTTELDLLQARYTLESTKAQIPELESALAQGEHRLCALLGLYPGSLAQELAASPIPVPPQKAAAGIPAQTLLQRPDVVKAERTLAARTARIGAAEGNRYPRLILSGSIGLDSLEAGTLFQSDSLGHSIGPRLTLPLFDGGALKRNVKIQEALRGQAYAAYRNTLLSALEEVENALTAFKKEREKQAALEKAVEAARSAVELANQQYASGLQDFRTVLETEKSLLSFETQLAVSKGAAATAYIQLYKALGGGWSGKTGKGPNPPRQAVTDGP